LYLIPTPKYKLENVMNMKSSKLAIAILALSLSQIGQANESAVDSETDKANTYWGVGIGSVLGAVIAGPPGAAIGATLGGSIGWGKDQHEALEQSQHVFGENTLALQERKQVLEKNLQQAEQEMQLLKRSNAQQVSRLKELQAKQESKAQERQFLERLVAHYTQDIYFRSGQAEAPEYAEARLANLVELLNAYPDLQVSLKGYTDPSGSAKLNAALAQARVDSIKHLLQTQGIEDNRISTVAIGEVQEAVTLSQQGEFKPEDVLNDLDAAQTSPAPVQHKKKDHILDRRVAIELHIQQSEAEQPLASLAVAE
jgi:outer membrane protein OmpA-like peptidoglycan-associated protein